MQMKLDVCAATLCALLTVMLGGCGGAPESADPPRPNIIFMLADDQRYDTMGIEGHPVVQSPNMDKLATDGVLFENAFLTAPICQPSRASIALSQWQGTHRTGFDRPTNRTISKAEFANSYHVRLREAGYRTGFIGKFGFAVTKEKISNDGLSPTSHEDSSIRDQVWQQEEAMPKEQFDFWRGFAGQGVFFPNGKDGDHLTKLHGDYALEFIRESTADQPFVLSISFKAPHTPFTPDPAYDDVYADVTIPRMANDAPEYFDVLARPVRENWRGTRIYRDTLAEEETYQDTLNKYYRLIYGIDVVIGRIRDELAALGLDQNTVIIYTSDNGYFTGSHQLGGKSLLYEESIRTPLLILDPRQDGSLRGRRVTELVSSADFGPTMLDLAGVAIPPTMQGQSLKPLLSGNAEGWRDSVMTENYFTSHFFPGLEDADDWTEKVSQMSVRSRAVRTARYKYIRYYEQRPVVEQLFDLVADPLEGTDLVADAAHADVLEDLRRRYEEWTAKVVRETTDDQE